MPAAWVRVKGSGLAVEGPCVLHNVLVRVTTSTNVVALYDGLSDAQGKLYHNFVPGAVVTRIYDFSAGVLFVSGIYVATTQATDLTLVMFTPVSE